MNWNICEDHWPGPDLDADYQPLRFFARLKTGGFREGEISPTSFGAVVTFGSFDSHDSIIEIIDSTGHKWVRNPHISPGCEIAINVEAIYL